MNNKKLITIKNIFVLLILLCLGGIALIPFMYKSFERMYSYYPTYQDAVKDGAVRRGWIPEEVPNTARDIHEEHDLDTNQVYIRFDAPASDIKELVKELRKLRYAENSDLDYCEPLKGRFWFDGFIEQQPANDAALYSTVYESEARSFYYAVDSTKPRVYYWTSCK